jgi:hypothetical protein
MASMGSRSANELLQLPVQLHGIRLGRPVDLLFDPTDWRALGFVVLCGDESRRFLVFPAAELREEAIDLVSALVLLEDVDFYRERSRSFRDLLHGIVVEEHRELGELRDLLLAPDGSVADLVVEQNGGRRSIEPTGVSVVAESVFTA